MILSKINRLIDACTSGDDSLDEKITEAKKQLESNEKSVERIMLTIEQGVLTEDTPFVKEQLYKHKSEEDKAKARLSDLYQQRNMLGTELARHRAESLRTAVLEYPEDKTLINTKMRECFSKVVVDFESTKLVFHWKQGGWTSLRYKASK